MIHNFSIMLLLLLSRFSRVRLCATPWTAAHQAPLSLGISRQEYWSGLPFPTKWDLPDTRLEPTSPPLAGGCFTIKPPWESPKKMLTLLKRKKIAKEVSKKWILATNHCRCFLENSCYLSCQPVILTHTDDPGLCLDLCCAKVRHFKQLLTFLHPAVPHYTLSLWEFFLYESLSGFVT